MIGASQRQPSMQMAMSDLYTIKPRYTSLYNSSAVTFTPQTIPTNLLVVKPTYPEGPCCQKCFTLIPEEAQKQ
jgi:hypothetical protein